MRMQEYTFTFRSDDWRIEAAFSLHFESDDHARSVARELRSHCRFPVMEVKQGASLVFHSDRRTRKDDAA